MTKIMENRRPQRRHVFTLTLDSNYVFTMVLQLF